MADKITRELQCAGTHRSALPADPALEQILAQLKIQPDNRNLLERAGLRLMELQMYREAGEYFSALLALFPFYGSAFLNRGLCHLVCWRYEEAASDLEVGVHHFPENWRAWFELGVSYLLGRNYDRAASILAFACRIAASEQELMTGTLWRWRALRRCGKMVEASAVLEELHPSLDTSFSHSAVHMNVGLLCGWITPEQIEEQLSRSDLPLADSIALRYNLQFYLMARGEAQAAAELLQQILASGDMTENTPHGCITGYRQLEYMAALNDAIERKIPVRKYLRTRKSMLNRQPSLIPREEQVVTWERCTISVSDTVRKCRQTIANQPQDPTAWIRYGKALASVGLLREAVEAYSHSLQLDPFRWEAYLERGHCQMNRWYLREACSDLVLADRYKPDEWSVLYHLGICYYLLRDYAGAERVLNKGLALSGSLMLRSACVSWLWRSLIRQEKYPAAEALLNSMPVVSDEACDSQIYFYESLLNRGLMTPEEVLKESSRGYRMDLVSIYYELSFYHRLHGNPSESDACLKKVLDMRFDFEKMQYGVLYAFPMFGFLAAVVDARKLGRNVEEILTADP